MRALRWRRWLLLSVALAAAAGVILWQASGFIAADLLERQLRAGGWPDAGVDGARIALPEASFARVRLTADETLVAEDVRARIGAAGVERIVIGLLRMRAEVTSDGEWIVPGASAGDGEALPLDVVPPDGVAVELAEVSVTTPLGGVEMALSDVVAQRLGDRVELSGRYTAGLRANAADVDLAARAVAATDGAEADVPEADLAGAVTADLDADGSARLRIRVDDGALAAGALRIGGLIGDATADVPAAGAPSLELAVDAGGVRVAGVELGALALTADWRNDTARFALASRELDGGGISVEGEATHSNGALGAVLTGRVQLPNDAAAQPAAQGLVELEAELEASTTDRSFPDRIRGRVRIDGSGLAYPDVLSAGTLALSADVEGGRDELRVTLDESSAVFTPGPALVPESARALAGAAATLRIAPAGEGPPTLRVSLANGSAELVGRIEVDAGEAQLDTGLRVQMDRRQGAGAASSGNAATRGGVPSARFALTAELADLAARMLPWGGLRLGAEGFDATIEHGGDGWQMAGGGRITAAGDLAAVRLDETAVDFAGTLTGSADRIVLAIEDCAVWRIRSAAVGDTRVSNIGPLCVAPGDDGVLLAYDRGADRADFSLSIDEQPIDSRLERAEAAYALDGRTPRLVLTGETAGAGIARLSARFAGGAVASPDGRIAASGFEGSAEWRDDAIVSAALRVARIESLDQPAPIAPVALELAAEAEGDTLSFDAVLSDDLGTFVLEAVGRHEPGRTSADVRLHPVRFVTGAVEIADLSPLLAEHIGEAGGVLEIDGGFVWSDGELAGSGTLGLREFGARAAGIRFDGVSTAIRFTSLLPPVTAPEQMLSIARVDLGMPLEHGSVVFDLDADGELAFRRVEFSFAGGRLLAEPFTIDSAAAEDIGFVLRAEDVELSHFLALSQIDGLAGTGVLSGSVPVRLADGGIRLDEGVLAAETDGVLRYTPNDLPDFLRGDDVRSRMLREVLTNFEYEELSLAVSGDSGEGGRQRLTLNARGANPDFLEGHPIELSFNFTGPLLGALRSAVDLTDAAELEQIFEQRETNNEENSR